jgi:hypothetical protein
MVNHNKPSESQQSRMGYCSSKSDAIMITDKKLEETEYKGIGIFVTYDKSYHHFLDWTNANHTSLGGSRVKKVSVVPGVSVSLS